MGLFALFLVMSFYSVIAGWTAAYLVKTASGSMSGLSPDEVGANFGSFLHQPGQMIFWHFLFTAATVFVVSRGVRIGLERLVRVLMPALLIPLVALVINSAVVGDFSTAVDFLFTADLSKLTPVVVLAAADTFELLSRVPLGELSYATPAVAGGVMYLRTQSQLFSLGGKK